MSDALLIALVLVAALACPLAMWWQARRGRPAACIVAPRNRSEGVDDDVEGLRTRHDELGARIARMESVQRSEPASPLRIRQCIRLITATLRKRRLVP